MDETLLRYECLKMAERLAGTNNEGALFALALRLYQWAKQAQP